MTSTATTRDPDEVAKFSALAQTWWDRNGPFKPLHIFNPTRLTFIRDEVVMRRGLDGTARQPLKGLRLLDIGCGGGLLSEPMARLGAEVTAIDASEKNVETARVHAEEMGLSITYRAMTAEELLAEGGPAFDVILNMEVVEHVADVDLFLTTTAHLLAPGGQLFVATLNRTAKSFALAKVGAEYVLRWLPRGTHDWRKFLKPSEVSTPLETAGLAVEPAIGVSFNPLTSTWSLSGDTAVNYMMVAERR